MDAETKQAVLRSLDRMQSSARHDLFHLDDEQIRLVGTIDVPMGGAMAQQSVATLYQAAILASIDRAITAVENGDGKEAAQELIKAHASVIAQAGEIQAVAEMANAASTPPGGPGGGPPPIPAPLQKLLAKLGAFGRWLWNLIGTMMTPKEWSIEGGVSLAWLADANISVTFG